MSDSYGTIKVDEIINSNGDTLDLANVVTTDTSGNAAFAGAVTSGNAPGTGTAVGAELQSGGTVSVCRTGSLPVFYGWQQGNSTQTTSITAAGAATFAGTLTVNENINGLKAISGSGTTTTPVLRTYSDTLAAYTANINADGSAEFKGEVQVGDESPWLVTDAKSSWIGEGAVELYRDVEGSTNGFIQGYTQVNGGTRKNAFSIYADGSGKFAGGLTSGGDQIVETGSLNVYQSANSGSTPVFNGGWNTGSGRNITSTIFSNGSATFSGAVTANGSVLTSDARFKENITPANSQLEDVAALGGILKNYDWSQDAPASDELRAVRQLGLIAQEAEAICPGVVKTIARTKQGEELTPEVKDEEGNVTEEATYETVDDSYKGISHDALVMKMLGAISDLKAEVESLKSQLS